ncbi:hypothetical protein [Leptospira noguchii]|uniref:Uncharacterized protein n=1 Tax=Leptospira noguchii serovar Autumnalis str. ZUN142 TaxID=1085540 RepID=M6U1Q2_9LEPT|nr:hypothetical protein [Leptospira noguchii]EKR74196.1 hypothetical protein LEP1GSC041_3507 [Leptospira noguchii str. 2006001870]EMO25522.1 hypothetical protein LEP1GSC170_1900 [Leptospira interrogans serovar Bataviae str. HAI135]EMO38962.1 hypothetical protein LEP1GSC186_0233 [Leptospira noguchii serovar Autumnalis str. ZUN142]EMS84241.1 hypothetical protein LEP1GSC074_1439 [Leptospira noguchii str. Hook]
MFGKVDSYQFEPEFSIAEQEKSNAAVFVGTTANQDFTVKL